MKFPTLALKVLGNNKSDKYNGAQNRKEVTREIEFWGLWSASGT